MSKKTLKVIINILTLVGAGISIYQSAHFFQLRNGSAGFDTFCKIGQVLDCEAVELSAYAELFGGIPLSSFAAGWFLAFFIISLFSHSEKWSNVAPKAMLAFAGVGLAFSAFYFLIMAFVLQKFCLLCLIVDGINLVLLFLILKLKPLSGSWELGASQWKTVLGTTAVSVLVAVGVGNSFNEFDISEADQEVLIQRVFRKPHVEIGSEKSGISVGSETAPVTIVKFSDFQCPSCRRGAFFLHPVLKQFKDKVRFIYKAFPLDMKCNRIIQRSMHTKACQAAEAAYCAEEQGKFQEVYESLFQNQDALEEKEVLEVLSDLDLNHEELKACLESERTLPKIKNDVEEGLKAEVEATPTFFINGLKVVGPYPPKIWEKMIQRLIEHGAH